VRILRFNNDLNRALVEHGSDASPDDDHFVAIHKVIRGEDGYYVNPMGGRWEGPWWWAQESADLLERRWPIVATDVPAKVGLPAAMIGYGS
jgi:hypothetical protein